MRAARLAISGSLFLSISRQILEWLVYMADMRILSQLRPRIEHRAAFARESALACTKRSDFGAQMAAFQLGAQAHVRA